VQTFIPWVAEGSGGFMLSGVAWSDEDALDYTRRSENKSVYIVVTHLKAQSDPWTVELRLLRTGDGKCLGKLDTSFDSSNPGKRVRELSQRLIALLTEQANISFKLPRRFMNCLMQII